MTDMRYPRLHPQRLLLPLKVKVQKFISTTATIGICRIGRYFFSESLRGGSRNRHPAGKTTPKRDTHVIEAVTLLACAVKLKAGEILYRFVLGHRRTVQNEAMQDFVASSFFSRVKPEPAWKL